MTAARAAPPAMGPRAAVIRSRMAAIQHLKTGARHALAARHLVGRTRSCDLRLQAPSVSGEHAVLWWSGEAWELRDLGSRNGTFLNGQRLAAGAAVALGRTNVVAFGHPEEAWQLVDVAPPEAMALPLDDGGAVCAEDGILALPDAARPEVSVYQDARGAWVAERGGATEPVEDQQQVSAGGQLWRLRLPELVPGTVAHAAQSVLSLERVALRFQVSLDEEHVALTVVHGERALALGARAHHHVLLVLARARLEDLRDPSLPETARGWLYQDDLLKMLAVDEGRLNTDIYRARRQLGAAGVAGAGGVVERRSATRQLRLGTERVEVLRG